MSGSELQRILVDLHAELASRHNYDRTWIALATRSWALVAMVKHAVAVQEVICVLGRLDLGSIVLFRYHLPRGVAG